MIRLWPPTGGPPGGVSPSCVCWCVPATCNTIGSSSRRLACCCSRTRVAPPCDLALLWPLTSVGPPALHPATHTTGWEGCVTALWCPSHSLSQFDLRPRHSCGPLPCLVPLRTQQPRAVSTIATTHNQCRGWSGPHTCTHAILAPSGCNQENGTLCPRHVPSAPQAARWWGPPGTSFCVSLCWSGQRPTDSSLVSSQLPGGALLGPHQAWKPLPQWRSGCSHTPLSGQACEHTTGHRDTLHSCTGSKTSSSLGCDKTGCGRGHRLTTGRGIPSAGPAGQRLQHRCFSKH